MYPKWTYLLISIIFLASSCNSDPIDDISLTNGTELSFGVSDISNLTRSSVATSINQFVVYGDKKSMAGESSDLIVMFDKQKVEFINDRWRYDGIQYWIPNYEHSFVAVSPETILETGNNPRYLNSKLSFEYSVPESGNVADILTATHRRLYLNNGSDATSDNSIIFTFSHLLSLINFAPAFDDNNMNNEEYLLFHKLEFSGVSTKAQFDIMPASRSTGSSTYDMEVDIKNGQEYGDYSIVFPTPVKVENNATNVRLFSGNDAIIMLPQVFEADSEAEITLSYTMNGDTSMNKVSIPLKNLKWESGKSHIYRFTLEKSGVKFDNCEINPWNVMPEENITAD